MTRWPAGVSICQPRPSKADRASRELPGNRNRARRPNGAISAGGTAKAASKPGGSRSPPRLAKNLADGDGGIAEREFVVRPMNMRVIGVIPACSTRDFANPGIRDYEELDEFVPVSVPYNV
jgi:hypothetical protein